MNHAPQKVGDVEGTFFCKVIISRFIRECMAAAKATGGGEEEVT